MVMTNYREILRMNSLGFNKTEISQSLQCSRTTVRTVIRLAEEHNRIRKSEVQDGGL